MFTQRYYLLLTQITKKGTRNASSQSRTPRPLVQHRLYPHSPNTMPSRRTGSSRKSSAPSRKGPASSRKRSDRPAYTYQANLKGGKKYIGMATSKANVKKRIQTQLSGGKGASSVCRNSKPISITKVYKHKNVAAAKKAETARYHSTKSILGADKVRGAGHTKAFSKRK